MDNNLLNSRTGNIVLGSAFIDDILALFLIAILASITQENIGFRGIAQITILIIIFFIAALTVISWIVEKILDKLYQLESRDIPFSFTIILGFFLAIVSKEIGLSYVAGSFVAGILISKWSSKPSPLLVYKISFHKIITKLTPILRGIFSPMFLGWVGMNFVFLLLTNYKNLSVMSIIFLAGIIGIGAFLGKILGCGISARLTGLTWFDSWNIGLGMCGRGALELIMVTYALEIGLIQPNVFFIIVIVSILSLIITPVFLSLAQFMKK
jgi:Kef-type K+ transport system membrane component KefB